MAGAVDGIGLRRVRGSGAGSLGRLAIRYPVEVTAAVLLLSVLHVAVLATEGISFETDLAAFLPDSPESRASDTIGATFPGQAAPLSILVESARTGTDVFGVGALRAEAHIAGRVATVPGVTGVISIAGALEELCRWVIVNGTPVNDPARDIDSCTDDELRSDANLTALFLRGDLHLHDVLPSAFTPSAEEDLRLTLRPLVPGEVGNTLTGRSTLIIVLLNYSLTSAQERTAALAVVAGARKALAADPANPGISLAFTGAALLTNAVDRESEQTNILLAALVFPAMGVVLALAFRRLSYVVLHLATLGLALLWTLGTARLLGLQLTALEVAVVPLVVALGAEFTVYIDWRYQEELRRLGSGRRREALRKASDHVTVPLLLSVVTIVASFAATVVTEIPPLRDFSFIASIGIVHAFLLAMTFQIAARTLIDRRTADPVVHTIKDIPVFDRTMATGAAVLTRYPVAVVLAVALVTMASIMGAATLRQEFSVRDFVPDSLPEMQTANTIQKAFPAGSYSEAFLLMEGDVATPEAYEALAGMTERLGNATGVVVVDGTPVVRSIHRIARLLSESNASFATAHHLLPDGHADPGATKGDIRALYEDLRTRSPDEVAQLLAWDDQGDPHAALVRLLVNVPSTAEAHALAADLNAARIVPPNTRVTPTGSAVLTVTTLDALKWGQVWSTVLSVAVSGLILVVYYGRQGRPMLGVLAVIPVLLSASWVLGTMAAFSISLNALTITITALIIGLGIDYSIHIVERFQEEVARSGVRQAMRASIEHTGTSIFISAMTTFLGFVLLVASPLPLVQTFGIITGAAIIFSFDLSVFVLPLGLVGWALWRRRRGLPVAVHEETGGFAPVEASEVRITGTRQQPPRNAQGDVGSRKPATSRADLLRSRGMRRSGSDRTPSMMSRTAEDDGDEQGEADLATDPDAVEVYEVEEHQRVGAEGEEEDTLDPDDGQSDDAGEE